jgi:hypothetical protein
MKITDHDSRASIASFAGTLALGRLCIALVFAANLVLYLGTQGHAGRWGVVLALLAAGVAYAAQTVYTYTVRPILGLSLQAITVGLCIAAGLQFILGS